jgi:predicted nucleic acid-binding protein
MSGMSLVLDASAALTLLRQEPGHDAVREHLAGRIAAGDEILVPGLFWLEVVNVLAVRYRFTPAAIVEAVYELEQLGMATTDVGRPGVLAVVDAVARSGLTAYDAAYLVLAESAGASLLTADADLAVAAGERAILVRGRGGVAEPVTQYAPADPWPMWRGAAAYLAELRSSL